VAEALNLVLKAFVDQNIDIELFVAPVDLKNWLETSQELVCLIKGCSDNLLNAFLLKTVGWRINNPCVRVQS
jgi:hypothetical protein